MSDYPFGPRANRIRAAGALCVIASFGLAFLCSNHGFGLVVAWIGGVVTMAVLGRLDP